MCLHFARGRCSAGGECAFLHRLPTAADDARASLTHDVFGRDRHATHCADNGGVGSFPLRASRRCSHTTAARSPRAGAERVRAAVLADFLEWGPVSDVRVVPTKCVAFVTYAHRSAAEFAKEAMAGQTLRRLAATAARERRNRGTRGTRKTRFVRALGNDDRTPRPAPPQARARRRRWTRSRGSSTIRG